MDAQKFTEKSLSALENAHGEAVRLHNSELSTLHLLNALVTQENGLVPRILEKMELDSGKLTRDLQELLKSLPTQNKGSTGRVAPSGEMNLVCLLYTSPSPRDRSVSRMPSSA